MGKYKTHEEFGANAPINWRESTTAEAYIKGKNGKGGLQRIAPPGMKPRLDIAKRFEEKTDVQKSAKWHRNYDIVMFDSPESPDVPGPDSVVRQLSLEELIKRGEINRILQVKQE